MELVIEGTLAEAVERLRTLPVPPETPLRVSVKEMPTDGGLKSPDDAPESPPEAYFANAQRRNGVIVLPLEYQGRPLTTEIVKQLSEGD